jgi:hypothetical protein
MLSRTTLVVSSPVSITSVATSAAPITSTIRPPSAPARKVGIDERFCGGVVSVMSRSCSGVA